MTVTRWLSRGLGGKVATSCSRHGRYLTTNEKEYVDFVEGLKGRRRCLEAWRGRTTIHSLSLLSSEVWTAESYPLRLLIPGYK